MELVEDSKELFDRIVEKGAFSEKEASSICRQLFGSIAHLHSKKVAHRDLKPENILTVETPDGIVVKLSHFGFGVGFTGDTKFQSVVGSPAYVAPEILTDEAYSESCDLWSIGVIIYVLLSGEPPFFAEAPPDLFKKIVGAEYNFDNPIWSEVSSEAKELINNLLVRDPAKRWTAEKCLKYDWVIGTGVNEEKLDVGDRMTDYINKRKKERA